MAKNLLKAIMDEAPRPAFSTAGLIEKINTGYLNGRQISTKPKKNFSPSSLAYGPAGGACPRFWHFKFAGEEQVDDVTHYSVANMSNGTLSHTRIQKAIENAGIMVGQEVKVVSNDPPIFGFVDNIIEWDGEELPVEIKIMREESWQFRNKDKVAPEYHVIQLLIYLRLLNKTRGIFLYESKNTHELLAIPLEVTDEYNKWLDYAFDWMREVRGTYTAGDLPRVPYRKNSKVCKKCPFKPVCDEAGIGSVDIAPLAGPISG